MARGKRTRLATGIYADAYGISIIVHRGDQRPEVRYPLGTPLDELRQARRDLIDEIEDGARPRTRRGSLRADVAACLQTIASPTYRRDQETLLEHWLRATLLIDGEPSTFGDQPRQTLTPLQIRTQLAVFQASRRTNGQPRFTPKTIKELRRVLGWVYTTLDGPDAKNPVRAVKVPRVTYDDPRGIDYAIIERIFTAIPDRGRPQDGPVGGSRRGKRCRPTVSLSKVRMRVMAYTGLHQIEVGRLRPAHIDLTRRRLWIEPRQKGTGSSGAWHRLTTPAVEALRAFVEAQAFGPFDPRGVARVWRHGVQAARVTWEREQAGQRHPAPWPLHEDARPYDLRHSVGTEVYIATGDIRAAQEILRHRQISTTLRYTRAGVSVRAEQARDALEARWVVPPAGSTRLGENEQERPPKSTSVQRPRWKALQGNSRKSSIKAGN